MSEENRSNDLSGAEKHESDAPTAPQVESRRRWYMQPITLQAFVGVLLLLANRGDPLRGRWDFLLRMAAVLFICLFIFQVLVRIGLVRTILVTPFLLWMGFEFAVGTYSSVRDVIVLLIVAGAWFFGTTTIHHAPLGRLSVSAIPLRKAIRVSLGILFTAWIATYACDAAFARFERRHNAPRDWSTLQDSWPTAHVGVTLSGGGYRAAVFHTGVLRGLERMHVRTRALSTVSGGSIIGAFYARGGDPEHLADLVTNGAFNLKRELFAPWNVARYIISARVPGTGKGWIVQEDFTRTNVQAGILDRLLLAGVPLNAPPPEGAPELVLCTTDLISGDMVGFFRGGYLVRPRLPVAFREPFLNGSSVVDTVSGRLFPSTPDDRITERPLSFYVSASGAFPGALRPPAITSRSGDQMRVDFLLADGGIADNLGLAVMREMMIQGLQNRISPDSAARESLQSLTALAAAMDSMVGEPTGKGRFSRSMAEADSAIHYQWQVMDNWRLHFVIASDASALPVQTTPGSMLAELGHAIDAVYRATGGTTMLMRRGEPAIPAILLSPATMLPARLSKYDVADLRSGDERERVLEFPYVVRGEERGTARAKLPLVDSLMQLTRAEELLEQSQGSTHSGAGNRNSTVDSLDVLIARARHLSRVEAFRDSTKALRERALQADYDLYLILRRRIARDIEIFMRTSTLDDHLDRDTVDALLRLGETMVILNRTFIEDSMNASAEIRIR